MEASYLRIRRDTRRAEDILRSFLELATHDPTRDWNTVCGLLSRCVEEYGPTASLDPSVVDQLADLHVYVELDDSDRTRCFRRRPTIERLKQHAAQQRFTRLFVSTIATLGQGLREVVATVYDLISQGVTIVSVSPDCEPVGPEVVGPLREVLNWHREIDRNKRSTAIRKGQTKVRARGKRVGRPKRIFDRQEVVRLRDQERRSWSQIAQALGIGIGTARRAYQQLAASPGPAKNIKGAA